MKQKLYLAISLLCILLLVGAAIAESIPAAPKVDGVDPQELAVSEGNQADLASVPPLAPEGKAPPAATTLATPILVSPANNVMMTHYPRVTTLTWRPVPYATGYRIERWYYAASWIAYPTVTVYGNTNAAYSFNFLGDQPGAWRVTAFNSTSSSVPSATWYFNYRTKYTLPTPVLVAPINNAHFFHYPRTTTLIWKPVPGATGYLVERAYLSGSTWVAYPTATVTGALACSYQFNFIGDQPGRWRVTATDSSGNFYSSTPSSWWQFDYSTTKPALATPVMIAPLNNTHFFHYPRVTTLTWKPVGGATGYLVERAYLSGSTWVAYPAATVTGTLNSAYTFSFVGDQPGRWRVTAIASGDTRNSTPSAWWQFDYKTKPTLSTPVPVSPAQLINFYHYPRKTTLTWSQVPGATGYTVRRWYYSGSSWTAYPAVTVPGVHNASYTFDFIGMQQGRWDVKAIGSPYYDSPTSTLRYFTYKI